jgi:hypothetical protein
MQTVIKRIYLDSEPLIAALWPRVSRELENLFIVASMNKVEVFVPKPVEAEMQARFARDLDDSIQQTKSSVAKLSKSTSRAGVTLAKALDLPSLDTVVINYEKSSDKAKTKWNVKSLPFTLRSPESLFQMAIERRGPFEWEKKGFKDAVIVLSVIDHLLAEPSPSGL